MKQSLYQQHFKGKKITVMGLGLLGRGVQVAEFLAKNGAILTVTDMKDAQTLAPSLKKLAKYKIRYVLGKHELKDFENVDMVVKAAGVPLDSRST
jgi:UDP-N-acetylmuramoylalanine--D-glutamate ligase